MTLAEIGEQHSLSGSVPGCIRPPSIDEDDSDTISGLLIGLFKAYFNSIYSADSDGTVFSNINSAFYFISAGATSSTTALIIGRISLTSPQSDSKFSGGYSHIQLMVVESAAVYSLVVILMAIFTVLPTPNRLATPTRQAAIYIGMVFPAVTVMSLSQRRIMCLQ